MPDNPEQEFETLKRENVRVYRTINHDIKSPLYAIQSLTAMFAQDPSSFSPEELNTMAVEINRSVGGMEEVLESLLSWMDYQTRRYEASTEPQDLKEQLLAAVHEEKSRADAKQVHIELHTDESIQVAALSGALIRATRALINNAIKFSPRGSTVRVELKKEADHATVLVHDQGPGLSPSVQQQLFHLEHRIMTEGSEGEKGAGVSLLMAKDAMERSRGNVGFLPAETGACFYLEIPLADISGTAADDGPGDETLGGAR